MKEGQTMLWPKKKEKRTNNDLQNTTQKTTGQATRTPLKSSGEFRCSGRVSSSCSTRDTRRVNASRREHHPRQIKNKKYNLVVAVLIPTENCRNRQN